MERKWRLGGIGRRMPETFRRPTTANRLVQALAGMTPREA